MSPEHGTPVKPLYEDEAFSHLFSDVEVIYPDDERYQWDQRRAVIDDREVYFAPSLATAQSGETNTLQRAEYPRRAEIIKAKGLGIFPSREQLRLTRERITLGAMAILAVIGGVSAAAISEQDSPDRSQSYAGDTSNRDDEPTKKPAIPKKLPKSRPENPTSDYVPVVVYENYSPSGSPSASVSASPSPSEKATESPLPTLPPASEVPQPTPSKTPNEPLPSQMSPSSELPSPTESAPTTPEEVLPSPSSSTTP